MQGTNQNLWEWMATIRHINPIRPAPRNNPTCYKNARVVRENNPPGPKHKPQSSNPTMEPPDTASNQAVHDIYEDTCLHALTLADGVSDELQTATGPDLRETLSPRLEQLACEKYRTDPEFRKKLEPCLNHKPGGRKANDEAAEARDWLKAEMQRWV